MVGLEKTYHTITVCRDISVEVTIWVKAPANERVANYYEKTHQEEIQQQIVQKLNNASLPKLSKQQAETTIPKKPVAQRSTTNQSALFEGSFYCSECNKYSYKGYRLSSGKCICRDCKNLRNNPNPKPRLVFQNVEGGRRKH